MRRVLIVSEDHHAVRSPLDNHNNTSYLIIPSHHSISNLILYAIQSLIHLPIHPYSGKPPCLDSYDDRWSSGTSTVPPSRWSGPTSTRSSVEWFRRIYLQGNGVLILAYHIFTVILAHVMILYYRTHIIMLHILSCPHEHLITLTTMSYRIISLHHTVSCMLQVKKWWYY